MAILTVGSGEQFATLTAAVAASHNGDVIQVSAGTYTNDFPQDITDNITIKGVGGMANFVATQQIPNGKAILITDGNITIDHLSFSGATVSQNNGANGAGIRYQSGNLVLTNDEFDNNQNGILGAANSTGTISISNSVFNGNGSGTGFTHGIYIGDIASLTVTNSLFENTAAGHQIKSRAETNVITHNVIADGSTGTSSYSIDLPNGGNATISNNTIEKGPHSQNPVLISYGEEGGVYANSSLTVSNNTLLDDQQNSHALGVRNSTSAQASVTGNTIYGLNPGNTLSGNGTATNNTYTNTEPTYSTASPIQSSTGGTTSGDTLVINVSEDAWQGDAQFVVTIDGTQVGGTYTATASHAAKQSQAITLSTSLSAGPHEVALNYINDSYGGSASADRNLYLDSATLNGNTIFGSTATLKWDGTAEFNTGTAAKTNTMFLLMSEQAFQGADAQFTVSVDGTQLGGVYTATAAHSAGNPEGFSFQGIPGFGSAHDLAITFLNPSAGASASGGRSLTVDAIKFNEQTVPGATATIYNGTADHFTLPASQF